MDLRDQTVLLLGDSQIQGLAEELEALIVAAGGSVTVSAHPGMSLKAAYETLPANIANGHDVVIVSFGGNNPPTEYSRAVTQMSGLLHLLIGRRVFWLTVLPSTDPDLQPARGQMAAWQKRYLPTKGVTVLDGNSLTDGLPRRDGLHLTPNGYTALATRIVSAIVRTGGRLVGVVAGAAVIGAAIAWWRNRHSGL